MRNDRKQHPCIYQRNEFWWKAIFNYKIILNQNLKANYLVRWIVLNRLQFIGFPFKKFVKYYLSQIDYVIKNRDTKCADYKMVHHFEIGNKLAEKWLSEGANCGNWDYHIYIGAPLEKVRKIKKILLSNILHNIHTFLKLISQYIHNFQIGLAELWILVEGHLGKCRNPILMRESLEKIREIKKLHLTNILVRKWGTSCSDFKMVHYFLIGYGYQKGANWGNVETPIKKKYKI